MSNTTPQPPSLDAGWYGDPDGTDRQRWWNGTNWTSDTRDGTSENPTTKPIAETSAPMATATASVTPRRPKNGRRWFWLTIAAVSIVWLIFSVFVGFSIRGEKRTDPTNGCGRALPAADYSNCVNRRGIWSGIDDVPSD